MFPPLGSVILHNLIDELPATTSIVATPTITGYGVGPFLVLTDHIYLSSENRPSGQIYKIEVAGSTSTYTVLGAAYTGPIRHPNMALRSRLISSSGNGYMSDTNLSPDTWTMVEPNANSVLGNTAWITDGSPDGTVFTAIVDWDFSLDRGASVYRTIRFNIQTTLI